jgi:hypothetical protein
MIHKSILAAAVLALGFGGAATAATPSVSASDAIAAVEASSGGKVVQLALNDQNGKPAYLISIKRSDGSSATFMVNGETGAVAPASVTEAAASGESIEAGEGPNDANSANEDAN